MINIKKGGRNFVTKNYILARQKTFDKKVFFELDKDISEDKSEMDTNIKQYQTLKKKNVFLDAEKSLKPISKLKTNLNRVYTHNYKIYDCYSIATNTTYNDKSVKKVTFSTVEIIRVEKYKKYNALNNFSKLSIQKNMEDIKNNKNNNDDDESICSIF